MGAMTALVTPAMAQQPLPYFGYYGNNDWINENYDHTNVTFAGVWTTDRTQATTILLNQLALAKSKGLKVVLGVDPFLFTNGGSESGSYGYQANAALYWKTFVDQLVAKGYLVPSNPSQNTIVAFYPVDEPNLKGLGDVNGAANSALSNAINVIHVNPNTANVPIATIVNHDYGNTLAGMRLFDWVGLDDYHANDSEYRSEFQQLESQLDLSRQRSIMVPQAFLKDGYGDANTPEVMFDMALSDPHVVLLMPFLWKHADFVGTGDLPALKSAYTYIGRQVKKSLYAQFVSQSVPTQLSAGRSYTVSVRYKNIGKATWTAAQAFNLGSQNPGDNSTWGVSRVHVPQDISPGETATFTFKVTAPTGTGKYNFQWRMVDDNVTWFGNATPNVSINVVTPASGYIFGSPNPCTIYSGRTTCTTTLSWSSNRSDAEVWVSNADGSGAQLFARAQSGSQAASWITTSHKLFTLRSGVDIIATMNVYGITSSSPPPGGGWTDPCPDLRKGTLTPTLINCP
jgi:hypothetical protein